MRPGEYGYFEGDQLGKPYDLRLLVRLARFARPYMPLLILTSILILAATAADLLLPYLTKMAIDRFIVVQAREVVAAPGTGPGNMALLERYQHLLRQTGREGHYFLADTDASRIDPRDLHRLRTEGLIRPESYYLVDTDSPAAREVVREGSYRFRVFPKLAAIATEDMSRLSREDLTRLRSADIAGLARIALICLVALLLGFLFNFFQVVFLEYTGQRLTHDLRQALLTKLFNQSISFHDRSPTGVLVARVTNDIQNLNEMINSLAVTLFKDAFMLAGIVAILVSINLRLALLTFTLIPPIVLVSQLFRRSARDVFRDMRNKVAQINAAFDETVSGIRIVQAFRRETYNQSRFGELNHENYRLGIRQIHVFAFFMPLIELLSSIALGLIIWYGGISVLRDVMTLGAVVAFIGYAQKFFQPIRDLAEKYNILQSAMASLERVFSLMDQQTTLPRPESARAVPEGPGAIEFQGVDFEYQTGEPVLHDVSFRVDPGQTLAIVGATGAGKTSIINLLLRFYDVTSGRVRVDGVDVRELDLEAHRARVGLVMQDVFLFSGSVRENIALSRDGWRPGEVEAAAKAVNASEFIEALPLGYDQPIGEGGRSLSAGQRQLLAFARVVAQDPKILVLDEATASIDSETEKLIEAGLERLLSGRTSIVIAHRLSTIRRADRIVVLHKGRISEMGSHDELMARGGLYHSLYQLQFRENHLAGPSGA
ncbi:MAG: ABC transporter ATP-binding protein/permease [Proteobacteria bacterium]|nr:ABC transporter ATP-binding protein/permease [Pseudomonadota bacterium]